MRPAVCGPLGPPEEWNLGGIRTVLNFRDPEGVQWQLTQQPEGPGAFGRTVNWPNGVSGLHGESGVDLFPTPAGKGKSSSK